MNKKRLFQIVVLAVFVVGAAYVLSIMFQSVRAVGDGDSSSPADFDPVEVATEAVSGLDPYLPMTVTKEDLTLEVLNYRWVENEARFDVKFPLVDERDWRVGNVYLEIDGKQYPLWATALVEMVLPAEDGEQVVLRYEDGIVKEEVNTETGEAYRIDSLAFGDVPSGLDQLTFSLVITEITSMPNEGGYCTPNMIQSIQGPMTEAFPGIEIVCISKPGFDGFEIASDSPYAKDTEALALFDTVVSHALNGRIISFWEFSFGE